MASAAIFAPSRGGLGLAIFLSISLGACSLLAVKTVPDSHKTGDPLECSKTLNYPLIDMTATVLTGIVAISLFSSAEDSTSGSSVAAYTTGAGALAFAGSALWGSFQVNDCKRAHMEQSNLGPGGVPTPDKKVEGELGGACGVDNNCDPGLICDATMRVCVKASN